MPENAKRAICPTCGSIVPLNLDALKKQKPDKVAGKRVLDKEQRSAKCPNCGGVAYRTIGDKVVADVL